MQDSFLEAFEARRREREQADRTITLAGEQLTFRPSVAPEVGMKLEAARQDTADRLKTLSDKATELDKVTARNGDAQADEDVAAMLAVTEAVEAVQEAEGRALETADATVLDCLDPDSHEAWGRLRSVEATHPLTFTEVFQIADYLLGKVAGIPTDAPAGSSDGRTATGKPSKASSSSKAKTPTPST